MKTLTAAQAAATADQNDIVYLLAESNTAASTTDYQTSITGLAWAKDAVHLIGQNAAPMFSHRSRIAWKSDTVPVSSLKPLVTFSGDGCYVENIEFMSSLDNAYANGVLVSGMRNHFKHCHFAGIGHATQDVTDAYSLSVTGDENVFENCVIGLDTTVRAGANNELVISGMRNVFKNCIFISYSVTAGRFIVSSTATNKWNLFENCSFINWTPNVETGQTNVFDMPAVATAGKVYLHACAAFGGGAAGIGSAWSDTDTNIFVSMPIPNTAGGKALAAT
jgi:hypothetical protein